MVVVYNLKRLNVNVGTYRSFTEEMGVFRRLIYMKFKPEKKKSKKSLRLNIDKHAGEIRETQLELNNKVGTVESTSMKVFLQNHQKQLHKLIDIYNTYTATDSHSTLLDEWVDDCDDEREYIRNDSVPVQNLTASEFVDYKRIFQELEISSFKTILKKTKNYYQLTTNETIMERKEFTTSLVRHYWKSLEDIYYLQNDLSNFELFFEEMTSFWNETQDCVEISGKSAQFKDAALQNICERSFTLTKHLAWMVQKKTEDSSESMMLNRHSSGKDFVQWKTRLTTHLDSQPVPKDYLLVIRLSDQLFKRIKKPEKKDYVKTPATATTPEVLDDKEFIKEAQRWNLTEGTIKKIVLERIEGTTLVDNFQAADTCYEGWEALLTEINFDKDNRAEALISQLHSFAQKTRETDLDYADRMAELVAHLRALDYPDRTNQAIANAHDLMVAKKFRLGLIENRFSFLSPIFKKDGIEGDFDKMRQYIVREAQDLQLSRAQRQMDRDESDDRALADEKRNSLRLQEEEELIELTAMIQTNYSLEGSRGK
ncbi:hypothetical protein HDU67_000874 [Dinochytrium kinnereticum]|nr:hypothetical protein HDU67_000874 [Dinochytrium kinnereticum]